MPKSKKTTLFAVIALVIAATVMAGCWFLFKPESSEGAKALTVLVTHGDGTTKTFTYQTDAEMLGEVLVAEGLIEGEAGPYGMYIKAVDGEPCDEEKQQWWGYTKRGEMVNYGVDMCPIADGEQYEFTLNTGW